MRHSSSESCLERPDQSDCILLRKSQSQINERLDTDHEILMMSIMNMPRCRGEGGDGQKNCSFSACENWEACGNDIAEKLFNIMCASFDDFLHEQDAMNRFNSEEHFNHHSEQHADLMKDISDVMRRFDANDNRREAIMSFRKIAQMLELHMKSTDAEMMSLQQR